MSFPGMNMPAKSFGSTARERDPRQRERATLARVDATRARALLRHAVTNEEWGRARRERRRVGRRTHEQGQRSLVDAHNGTEPAGHKTEYIQQNTQVRSAAPLAAERRRTQKHPTQPPSVAPAHQCVPPPASSGTNRSVVREDPKCSPWTDRKTDPASSSGRAAVQVSPGASGPSRPNRITSFAYSMSAGGGTSRSNQSVNAAEPRSAAAAAVISADAQTPSPRSLACVGKTWFGRPRAREALK